MTTIECRDEDRGIDVTVTLVAGTRTKGIGYAGDVPVCVWAGVVQEAPRPGGKWCWGDSHEGEGTGNQWCVVSRGGRLFWTEMKPTMAGSGWSIL